VPGRCLLSGACPAKSKRILFFKATRRKCKKDQFALVKGKFLVGRTDLLTV
jgi:hypothetical protein